MAGTYKTSNIELIGDYIGPIWMPNVICGKHDVTVTLDRNEHTPWTEHYDGDITYNVNHMANDGDFRYVKFIHLTLKVTRTGIAGTTRVTRTRYIDLSKRFDDMIADDALIAEYYEHGDPYAYNDEEDAA